MSRASAEVQESLQIMEDVKRSLWTYFWEEKVSLAPHILTLVAPCSKCT